MFVDVFGSPEDPNAGMDVNIFEGRKYAHLEDTLGTIFGLDIAGTSCNYRPYSRITNEFRIVIDSTAPANGRIIVQVVNQDYELSRGRAVLNFQSSILLGETKYYYAVADPYNSPKLIIKETTDPRSNPGLSDVIFEDPVIAADAVTFHYHEQYCELRLLTFRLVHKMGAGQ